MNETDLFFKDQLFLHLSRKQNGSLFVKLPILFYEKKKEEHKFWKGNWKKCTEFIILSGSKSFGGEK